MTLPWRVRLYALDMVRGFAGNGWWSYLGAGGVEPASHLCIGKSLLEADGGTGDVLLREKPCVAPSSCLEKIEGRRFAFVR